MHQLVSLLALGSLAAATAIGQRPLPGHVDSQTPFIKPKPKNLVSSAALEGHISEKSLLERAKELYKIAELGKDEYNHPTRVIGSKGHTATLDYIHRTIAGLGDYYTISNQTFNAVIGNVFESRLVLGDKEPLSAVPMSLTPPTKKKNSVFGPLILVDNNGCQAADYSSKINGSIAFIKRGTCAFGDKSELAGKAGAIAAVIYNNEKGLFGGTLGTPSKFHVATFGLSLEDATEYLEKLKAGETISSSAYINSIVENAATTNIVAQTTSGDQDNCVMLGAHSDSVAEGPGINDDGSGTLTLLEIATHLAKYEVNNCVRFAWWAAEEEGLLGSDHYVNQLSEEENLKIRLFMDYDMLASPNYAYQIYDANNIANPVGSEELRELYKQWYTEHDLNYTMIPFDGRSDYDGFIRHGIPGGGIATGAEGIKTDLEQELFGGKAGDWFDPCYHQLCDDISNLALDAWVINTKLVAHSVATYAISFENFPKRTSMETATHVPYQPKYHGLLVL
ncbi:aminopeptidase [Bisporella sp. PMI_857]|nr:aminopeptidase [Bisporella sp. PMI_857]